jgi:RimJ/RimL family protein N-acetyltransferase
MILETPRLILRPFAADDFDRMAELMANKDFMRFSMGPMTQEQTKSFLNKVIGWDRDGMPSQFAMIVRSVKRSLATAAFFTTKSMAKWKLRLVTDWTALFGTADSLLKQHAPFAIMVFAT